MHTCVLADVRPLKLSLCGGTALTHDAVSALLRLPILTELDIGGCCRIIAMDKMRLVAKVRRVHMWVWVWVTCGRGSVGVDVDVGLGLGLVVGLWV